MDVFGLNLYFIETFNVFISYICMKFNRFVRAFVAAAKFAWGLGVSRAAKAGDQSLQNK